MSKSNIETKPEQSCVGCKFLYFQDIGWSNYTVEDTETLCAKDANPNLPAIEPYDWTSGGGDNWPATNQSRCALYVKGDQVKFDVDGEVLPSEYTDDPETIAAVCAHSGRFAEPPK